MKGNNNLALILRGLLLLLLQVLLLNQILFLGYLNPYVYPLFILLLPPQWSRSTLLFVGFGYGLLLDMVENTGGLHAAATTFLAFIRPGLVRAISTQGGNEYEYFSLRQLGLPKYSVYVGLGFFLHNLILFLLEAFRFSELFDVLFRTVLSTTFSTLLVLLVQWFFLKKDR